MHICISLWYIELQYEKLWIKIWLYKFAFLLDFFFHFFAICIYLNIALSFSSFNVFVIYKNTYVILYSLYRKSFFFFLLLYFWDFLQYLHSLFGAEYACLKKKWNTKKEKYIKRINVFMSCIYYLHFVKSNIEKLESSQMYF